MNSSLRRLIRSRVCMGLLCLVLIVLSSNRVSMKSSRNCVRQL